MAKPQKSYIVLLVLLSQTVLSVTLGMLVLHMSSKSNILSDVYIDSLYVGNQTKSQAELKVREYFDKFADNSNLLIKYGDGKEYNIKFSDIEFSIDYEATVDQAYTINEGNGLARLIKGFFYTDRNTVYPVVSFDEKKLEEKLREFEFLIDKSPVNARMYLENGKIRKVSEVSGVKLNISNSIEKIKNELGRHLNTPIEFETENDREINTIKPELTLDMLEGVDYVISSYTTQIKAPEIKDAVKECSKAINGCLILNLGGDKQKNKVFSFKEWLTKKDLVIEKENIGYSQVASTLHAALLKTGIDINYIDSNRNKLTTDYIDPGLDVNIAEGEDDLKFSNPFAFPIAIFSECDDDSVTVYIVGNKTADYAEKELEVKVVQWFEPPILRVVNYDLKPDEEKVISSGKKGIEVEVYRVNKEKGKENSQLLYVNKYDAIGAIMQVGPKTRPDSYMDK